MVIVVVAMVAVARLAFAALHAGAYLAFASQFRRLGTARLARAGVIASLAATTLPLAGLALAVEGAVTVWRETPPGGMRRIVEIPILVAGLAALETIPAMLLAAALLVLLTLAQRRPRR